MEQPEPVDALGIEHIGSTSVPGLAAKPIVDVLLTVADVSNEVACVPALESPGFVLWVREPGPNGSARLPRPAGWAVRGRRGS
jgi:GrpB-like predicted nucleotidyltransferase (UPF0157 family)